MRGKRQTSPFFLQEWTLQGCPQIEPCAQLNRGLRLVQKLRCLPAGLSERRSETARGRGPAELTTHSPAPRRLGEGCASRFASRAKSVSRCGTNETTPCSEPLFRLRLLCLLVSGIAAEGNRWARSLGAPPPPPSPVEFHTPNRSAAGDFPRIAGRLARAGV